MYNITISQITYQLKANKKYKQIKKLYSLKTDNLTTELLRLKRIYKDFSYIIDFEKI